MHALLARLGNARTGRLWLLLSVVAAIFLVIILLLSGQFSSLKIVDQFPPPNAQAVSNRPTIVVTFNESVTNPEALQITAEPTAQFAAAWHGHTLELSPNRPLRPDQTYSLTIDGPLQGSSGSALSEPTTWRFKTRPARLLYLGWDSEDYVQLFLLSWSEGRLTEPVSRQLTTTEFGVSSFDHDQLGDRVVFAALRADGGRDLWLLNLLTEEVRLLLDCGQGTGAGNCDGVVWRPGHELVLFEWYSLDRNGKTGRLYWLDVGSGESRPVFNDPDLNGQGAAFSSDGLWLSFIAPTDPGIRAINLETLATNFFPSQAGQIPVWQPAGNQLIIGDLHLYAAGFAQHLYQVSVTTGEVLDLSDGADIEDGGAAWSYDGRWIAFGRKAPRVNQGRQIWLHQIDGGQQRQLTEAFSINHSVLRWSFDDAQLLHQRFNLAEPASRPSIWLLDISTGLEQKLIMAGFLPVWLP